MGDAVGFKHTNIPFCVSGNSQLISNINCLRSQPGGAWVGPSGALLDDGNKGPPCLGSLHSDRKRDAVNCNRDTTELRNSFLLSQERSGSVGHL